MAQQTVWEKVKTGGKAGFDKTWHALDKLGAPVNRLSNKLGSEAFWPTTLDKECDKAARILRSFCKDGYYEEETKKPLVGPALKQRVLKKIPASVIRNALGLAIFTTMRTGLWVSGAGGSGVLVARKDDGMWSPPSGILLHTAGLGFLVGVDIYDCVIVLNTQAAVDAFSKIRCTIGGEISAVAGPAGVGGVIDSEVHKRQAPLFTYLKSRGFYAGVQVDGTIVIERTDENERFYGSRMPVADILSGKVRHPPREIDTLMETIRAAQGELNINEAILPDGPPPADYEIEGNESTFGVPDSEDPDPFGVVALEKEGFVIREAGTQKRVTSQYFDFKPSPTSPIYANFRKSSIDDTRRDSWRESTVSSKASISGVFRGNYATSTASTQTDFEDTGQTSGVIQMEDNDKPLTPPRLPPRTLQNGVQESPPALPPRGRPTNPRPETLNLVTTPPTAESSKVTSPMSASDDGDDHDNDEEEPVVYEVVTSPTSQVITKPRMVNVPKLVAPSVPPRHPSRSLRSPSESSTRDASSRGDPSIRDDASTKDQAIMTSAPPSPIKSTTDESSFKSISSKENVEREPSQSPPTRSASPQSKHDVPKTEAVEEEAPSMPTPKENIQEEEEASSIATPKENTKEEDTVSTAETEPVTPLEHPMHADLDQKDEPPMSDVPLDTEEPSKPTLATTESDSKSPPSKADGPHISLASIRGGLSPVKSNETDLYDDDFS